MPGFRNIFIYPIEAINAIKTNAWSVVLIVIGSVLVLHGKDAVGGSLVTGGFAILRTESSSSSGPPAKQVPDPNVAKE